MAEDKDQTNKHQFTPPPLPGKAQQNKPIIEMGRQEQKAGPVLPKMPPLQKPSLPGMKPMLPKQQSVPQSNSAQSSNEVEEVRKQLETQMSELRNQLQEEREKLLIQTVKAKEEESLASKVEESLKDIQDRLRREKREQELQESLSKTEGQNKELEQRLAQERQTWVETLKTQMSQREGNERETEHQFELRMKELERRWHEEKLSWSVAVKNKEQEMLQLKKEMQSALVSEQDNYEKKIVYLESDRESLKRELKDVSEIRQEEKTSLLEKLELRDKDFLSVKAQQAMLVSQIRQTKEKNDQLMQVLEKIRAEKNTLISQVETKEKDFFLMKTQMALYQTRAKSEQEKLLKELVLYKEHAEKDSQQGQLNIRAKEEEINLIKRAVEKREMELKQEIEKKELEIGSVVKQYEERMRSRENELKNLWEKKEADHIASMKQVEERMRSRENELNASFEKREAAHVSSMKQAEEQMRNRENELKASFEKKEAEHASSLQKLEEQMRGRENELKASYEKKEADHVSSLKQAEEQMRNREYDLKASYAKKEAENASNLQKMEERMSGRENELKVFYDKKEAEYISSIKQMEERMRVRESELKAFYEKKEVEYISSIKQLEERMKNSEQGFINSLSKKDEQLKAEQEKWAEKIQAKDIEITRQIERHNSLEVTIGKNGEYIHDLEEKILGINEELVKSREHLALKENEFARNLNQKELEFKNEKNLLSEALKESERKITEHLNKENGLNILLEKSGARINELDSAIKSLKTEIDNKNYGKIRQENEFRAQKEKLESLVKVQEDKIANHQAMEQDLNIKLSQSQSRIEEQEKKILRFTEELSDFKQEDKRKAERINVFLNEKNEMFLLKEEQIKAVKQKYQEELKTSEMIKKDMESELRLSQKDIEQLRREMDKLRDEYQFKEKMIEVENRQKESFYKQEIGVLQEKMSGLEKFVEGTNQKLGYGQEMIKQKESAFISERAELIAKIDELKEYNVKLKAENEKTQTFRHDFEKNLAGELDNLKNVMRRELEEVEIDMKRERAKLESKITEKQKEIAELLGKYEEQENKLSEKQREIEELHKKQSGLENKLAEEYSSRGVMLSKLTQETEYKVKESREKLEEDKKQVINELNKSKIEEDTLRKQIEELHAKYVGLEKSAQIKDEEKEKVMEEIIAPESNTQDVKTEFDSLSSEAIRSLLDEHLQKGLSEKQTKSILAKVWQSLNEPVIEIKLGDTNKN